MKYAYFIRIQPVIAIPSIPHPREAGGRMQEAGENSKSKVNMM